MRDYSCSRMWAFFERGHHNLILARDAYHRDLHDGTRVFRQLSTGVTKSMWTRFLTKTPDMEPAFNLQPCGPNPMYGGYMGIMEKKMETTIGFRVYYLAEHQTWLKTSRSCPKLELHFGGSNYFGKLLFHMRPIRRPHIGRKY